MEAETKPDLKKVDANEMLVELVRRGVLEAKRSPAGRSYAVCEQDLTPECAEALRKLTS